MSQCPSSSFQVLFNAALEDYRSQTGTRLLDHPFAKQLEACNSVDSITAVLREQVQISREFRGDDTNIMKSLKASVDILYTLSNSTILGEGIGLPFPPANAIFTGIAILLAAVKDISSSYDSLVDLFASFKNFLSRLSIYAGVPPTPALTNVLVKIIVELLSTLALATKQVKQGRFKKFLEKLRGENDIDATLQRLDRLTLDESRATAAHTLEVVYGLVRNTRVVMDGGNVPAESISSALESIQEFVNKANKAEREKLQQDVRQWLSPPDPWMNHNLARESRHSGTGAWWIRGDTYAEWKSSGPSSLLWINGKPGAGKSVICSAIIEDIRALRKSGLASLAFFYCDFRDDQKKDRRGLFSSLLVQLCGQSDAYATILSNFYAAHDRGSQHASDSELAGCLEDMLRLPGQAPVHIVIDALDECPIATGLPSPRDKVLELVEELVELQMPDLRICVTSRPEADIVPVLEPLAFRSISLHGESGQVEDIAEYVRSVVQKNREMRRWKDTDKQLVIDELIKKANGMFRWVFCQLVYLRGCLPGRIRRTLEELPETLDETYARSLEEIDKKNWEYAYRLFQCVAAASRPLRVDELAEFLAFDFEAGSTPTLVTDWRPEDPAYAVLSVCSSLLVIVGPELSEDDDDDDDDDDYNNSPVIQFAHFSVKEYLTSARLAKAKDTISRFHVSMTAAHTIVAQACLGVLLHLDENVTWDTLQKFPLAEYAAKHWVGHVRSENVSANVQDGMKRLFDPGRRHLSVWVWVYDPESPWLRRERSERPGKARATPLYYAAFCGLHDIAAFLIVEHSQEVNARGFDEEETPLHAASRWGYADIAQLLLEHGADAEALGEKQCTPLLLASKTGHAEVARVLLEHGADIEARDRYHWSALVSASMGGHVEVARVLLEHGADVKPQDGNSTPLHFARGEMVARVLIKQGADANAVNETGQTPLHFISNSGCLEVARVLLEHGADANSRDADNSTPLHLASDHASYEPEDFPDVVRLLLQYNSDIHARDNGGHTPFMLAKALRHHVIMQVLLEHGAEGNDDLTDSESEASWGSERLS